MNKEIKNLPASVHQRLKNLTSQSGKTFQEVFYYYAMERFLYRLACSQYSKYFVLKGGLMFIAWGIPLRRLTRDIDLQGIQYYSIEDVLTIVRNICTLNVEPDGMTYLPDSVRGETIMNQAKYPGIRIYFNGHLGNALIPLHLDISFANVITPSEITIKYPSLIDMPGFEMLGYPYETAIAEKFQSMVELGTINDRLKDFFDIWLLSQQIEILGPSLLDAIQATFLNRGTPLPDNLPTALKLDFAVKKQSDWERFLKRSRLDTNEFPSFKNIILTLQELLWPIMVAANQHRPFTKLWKNGGPWEDLADR